MSFSDATTITCIWVLNSFLSELKLWPLYVGTFWLRRCQRKEERWQIRQVGGEPCLSVCTLPLSASQQSGILSNIWCSVFLEYPFFIPWCFHLQDGYASFATSLFEVWLQFCKNNGPACLFGILLRPCQSQKSSVDFPTILWQWHWHELWQHVRTLHQMQQRDGWVRDDAFLTDLICRHLAQLITDKKVHYVWPKESDVTRGGRLKDWLLTGWFRHSCMFGSSSRCG